MQSKMNFSMVKNIEYDLSKGDSFVSSLITLRKVKEYLRLAGLNIAVGRHFKTKQQDLDFAAALGVRIPQVYQVGCDFDSIKLVANTVIKPSRGASSCGVFVVSDNFSLRSVRSGKVYLDKDAALAEIEPFKADISFGDWRVEECLSYQGRPAHDLKVYCFYGMAGLFVEIKRDASKPRYCVYDENRQRLEFEQEPEFYRDTALAYEGQGVPDSAIELGRILSLNTPTPFLRIDFLVSDLGLYLGEITPNPGRYAGGYSSNLDNRLGSLFNQAWSRLLADLVSGKRFDLYHRIYGGDAVPQLVKALPLEWLGRLADASSSFKKKNTRLQLKSQGLIYSAFSAGGFCVPRELAQRDAKTRIDQFGLSSEDWQGQSVLDLGCNNGAMLFELSNLGIASGLGLEFDAEKVALAQEITDFCAVDQLSFQQADIDTLVADTLGVFDVVLALAIEAHVNDPGHLFALLAQVTGRVLCFEGNSRCDVEATRERLLESGFNRVEYKGFCTDDILPANNTRPVLIAWKSTT